jgi:monothiol glutaredoxin
MTTTNAPVRIRQISVEELQSMLDGGGPLELWDVRTDGERTLLVFHCHHGIRSQSAGQHFVAKGFTNVCNVVGGIEAWSLRIDGSVPRY